ncbi:MAG: DUF4325 domain-containing protein [Nitrospirae bacterium]|nr:DUF4325 domain-containing protein [Nitrospirota bacterium]
MDQRIWLKVEELAPKTLTRDRAREVIQKVREKVSDLRGKTIVLDLRGSESVSGSFLDELLLRRNDLLSEGLSDLQFASDSAELSSRLLANAQIRQVSLTLLDHDTERTFVPDPKTPRSIPQSFPVGDVANVPRNPFTGD